jgi:hypothetical protein
MNRREFVAGSLAAVGAPSVLPAGEGTWKPSAVMQAQ